MVTVMFDERERVVPDGIDSMDAFVEWMQSDAVPENGRFWWLQGHVWVDYDMEDMFIHADIKAEITSILRQIVKASKMGRFLPDGVLIANSDADLSGEPDALFVSNHSIEEKIVRVSSKKRGKSTVLYGSPDMVLEVVSRSSVRKDKITLLKAYWEAGVKEYWLADARHEPFTFDIYRRGPRSFQRVRAQDGWLKSSVFGKAFKLIETTDQNDLLEYSLEVQ